MIITIVHDISKVLCQTWQSTAQNIPVVIIIWLWSKRLQNFSMHFDLWQAWLSDLLVWCLLHATTNVECRLDKICLDVLVSCCHAMGYRVHIYWQAPIQNINTLKTTPYSYIFEKYKFLICFWLNRFHLYLFLTDMVRIAWYSLKILAIEMLSDYWRNTATSIVHLMMIYRVSWGVLVRAGQHFTGALSQAKNLDPLHQLLFAKWRCN